MKPLSDPPKVHGLSANSPAGKILCNSVWIRGGYAASACGLINIPLPVLRDLRGLILRSLRRYFIADSRYRFFGIFPITESTEAKISFT